MPFGLVTKAMLKETEERLRHELEAAEWDAKQWYSKFRALYARMVKAAGTGDSMADSRSGDAVPPEGGASPAATIEPERLRNWRARRGF